METIGMICLWLFSGGTLLVIVFGIIESILRKCSDENPIKKWWRTHIIGINPYE